MTERHLSRTDELICAFDRFLRITTGALGSGERPSPASAIPDTVLAVDSRRKVAGLMRVNHTGEVCAQALYEGQALTASNPDVANALHKASEEELDHLAWCEQRLKELDSRVSYLNPMWYLASLAMGATAGSLGNRINLGFVAATEDEVIDHLDRHLAELPADDARSREILSQMREDESRHADTALASGGARFPRPVKTLMRWVSNLMTRSAYWV